MTQQVAGLPWVRPVRLLHVTEVPQRPDAQHVVALGRPVAGLEALVVHTVDVDGVHAITDLAPHDASHVALPHDTLTALLERLAAPDGSVTVRIDGTPLRVAVLTALLEVPVGQTRSYTALAAAAGAPRAVRAAAHVMATNRVPLLLPCHRIVPASGGTGRYAFGPDTKATLLRSEATAADRPPRRHDRSVA